MKNLSNVKGEEEFAKACIKYYTGENLCYVFNKALRNFEKFYVEMGYFIGPFYNSLFKYAIKHKEKALNKKSKLYRDLTMDKLDLYSYIFCENDIICFPSFTSTTLNENLNFQPSNNAKKVNNIGELEEKSYVKMIISYEPKGYCIPQGLDVSEESQFSYEKEILLFPFTFLKIDKVEIHSGTENDKHYIYLTIINRANILEKGLNNNYSFKLVDNGSKLIVDSYNNLECDNNELYYKMNYNIIDDDNVDDNANDKDNDKDNVNANDKMNDKDKDSVNDKANDKDNFNVNDNANNKDNDKDNVNVNVNDNAKDKAIDYECCCII